MADAAANGGSAGIDGALTRLIEAGLISVLLLDEMLVVIARRGVLAKAVPSGVAIDEALPYLAGMAPDLLNLQDEPEAVFLLANVGLAGAAETEKINIEAFWQPADRRYCLLLHRLGLRTGPETEIMKQIKSRRIAEQHLQQTRRDLSARQWLVESLDQGAPVALAVFDPGLAYRFATRAWRELFGLGPEPVSGVLASASPLVAAFVNAERLRPVLAGRTLRDEDAPGSPGLVRWSAAPALKGEGATQGIVVVAFNRTDAQDEIARLTRQVGALEARNRALDEFVATIAHDLEAPRRAIDRAVAEPGPRTLAEIAEHSERQRRMLADLLEHAHAAMELAVLEPIDLNRLASEALNLTGRAEAFQIVCRPESARLTADRVPIETILRNLIANAVRHHDRDSGLIELTLLDAGEDWRLSIADDGPGIPESERMLMLEPFRRSERSAGTDGSGLGLALVATAVRRLGGSIQVEASSNGGRGAMFTIVWPKAPVTSGSPGENPGHCQRQGVS